MELRPIPEKRLAEWRKHYRAYLGIPVIPDFHDALCQMGRAYLVEEVGQALGYVIFTQETLLSDGAPVIPEFFLEIEPTKYARRLVEEIIRKLQPRTLIGRTDDTRCFPLLMDLRMRNSVASALYVLEDKPQWAEDDYLTIEESSLDDARELLAIYSSVPPEQGGIPDEMALTKSLALWRHYRLLVEGNVAAICYVAPQIQRYVTTATIVAEASRSKGYGRYLTAYAVKREISEDKTVVVANNPDNEAARGLLESLGARLTTHFIHFRP